MKFARLASRVAVGGVSAALATAGLVGVTASSASAAPVSTTYNCSAAGQTFPVPVSVDIALLPSTAVAGFPVPAGLLSFNSTLSVPDAVQQQLNLLVNNTGAKSDDFGTAFGSTVAKAPTAWTKPAAATNGVWVYTGKGSNSAFVLPKAGTYTVSMPTSFTLVTTGGTAPVTATCTATGTPATIGTIALSKQTSTVKAKATPTTAKKGTLILVKGKVTNQYAKTGGPVATGKVLVKDGKKTVAKGKLKNGKFKVKVKGLGVGSHKLTVLYKGDGYTDKSKSKAIKVTIKA
jgi:hypothetical protein